MMMMANDDNDDDDDYGNVHHRCSQDFVWGALFSSPSIDGLKLLNNHYISLQSPLPSKKCPKLFYLGVHLV